MFGCTTQNREIKNSLKVEFERKIPAHFSEKDFKMLSDFCNKLEVEELVNGYDGLYIRLFISYKHSDSVRLYTIKRRDDSVKIIVSELLIFYNSESSFIDSVYKSVSYPVSRSDHKELIRHLEKLNIYNLLDYSEINNYKIPTDSKNVFIEIANRNIYKLCFYPDLSLNSDINETKDIVGIINYLDRELNLKPVW